jgi:hypothetical protein
MDLRNNSCCTEPFAVSLYESLYLDMHGFETMEYIESIGFVPKESDYYFFAELSHFWRFCILVPIPKTKFRAKQNPSITRRRRHCLQKCMPRLQPKP